MSDEGRARTSSGPFLASQVGPGDRYELTNGHAVYCSPTGGDGAQRLGRGFAALATDPAVKEAGIDAGYSNDPKHLRAPDIAIGNVPDAPGWISGVPPLAVEYAGRGQDEAELQAKIRELLAAGTRWVWVVRLLGPRRVEVYEPSAPMRLVTAGEHLAAPGVLANTVPVEALWDEAAADAVTLRNLLQREGYADLDAVRREAMHRGVEEGLERGLEQGRIIEARSALRRLLARRSLAPTLEDEARIEACTSKETLDRWLDRVLDAATASDVFGS